MIASLPSLPVVSSAAASPGSTPAASASGGDSGSADFASLLGAAQRPAQAAPVDGLAPTGTPALGDFTPPAEDEPVMAVRKPTIDTPEKPDKRLTQRTPPLTQPTALPGSTTPLVDPSIDKTVDTAVPERSKPQRDEAPGAEAQVPAPVTILPAPPEAAPLPVATVPARTPQQPVQADLPDVDPVRTKTAPNPIRVGPGQLPAQGDAGRKPGAQAALKGEETPVQPAAEAAPADRQPAPTAASAAATAAAAADSAPTAAPVPTAVAGTPHIPAPVASSSNPPAPARVETTPSRSAATRAEAAATPTAAAAPARSDSKTEARNEFRIADAADTPRSPQQAAEPGPVGTTPLAAAGAAVAPASSFIAEARSTAAPTVAQARLDAAPGSPDFAPALGAQVSTFVRNGVQHAVLELNPAAMGPVSVQIQLDGNAAQVMLGASQADTRQALEQAMPQLAGSLREAGLTLAGGGVFDQPRQQQPSADADAGRTNGSSRSNGPADAPLAAADSTRAWPARRRGVVDLVA
jgi:flagellar hook-length control protein FliK